MDLCRGVSTCPDKPGAPPWEEVFSEISEAGYKWCELGPVGYLPNDDERVRAELEARGLGVAGSYIFEPLHDAGRHDHIAEVTHTTCRRIAGLGGSYLVVIDMVSDERGATAGRSAAAPRLDGQPYDVLLKGLRQSAGIAAEHGLTPVLHPHAGSYIEFEDEIERVLADTADDGLQLCIDTGHFAYAGVDPVRFLAEHRDRTPYLHFKDIDPIVLQKVVSDAVAVLRRDLPRCVLPGWARHGRLQCAGRGAAQRFRRPGHHRAGPRLQVTDHAVGRRQGEPRLPPRPGFDRLTHNVRRVTATFDPLAAA